MKKYFLSPNAKIVVDILLVLTLPAIWISGETEIIPDAYWRSFHCIAGSFWFLLMLVHVAQHWKFIKALTKKKVILKNRVTALTTFWFIPVFLSLLLLVFRLNEPTASFHHLAGQVFLIIVIIHAIQKSKRFIGLFQRKKHKAVKTENLNRIA